MRPLAIFGFGGASARGTGGGSACDGAARSVALREEDDKVGLVGAQVSQLGSLRPRTRASEGLERACVEGRSLRSRKGRKLPLRTARPPKCTAQHGKSEDA